MINKRNIVYKESSLPYSFCYKMRNAFNGKVCPVCNKIMRNYYKSPSRPSIQHNLPVSLGGKHELDNISVICITCNSCIILLI